MTRSRLGSTARASGTLTMGRALRAAGRAPDKVALRFGSQTRTYRELDRRVCQVTRATIAELGLERGHNAAIVAGNGLEYLEIVIGVPEAGVAVATLNARLTPAEIVCAPAQFRRQGHQR